ncbi:carbohydrate ABC transporter permease [Schaalia naturae]|uniref:Carbohydrate ABC transporter permease n=1 Tax=Schaalia naturae TaxID=635203 RepID=A0ABW2SPR2_9ACTO
MRESSSISAAAGRARQTLSSRAASAVAVVVALVWTIPTIGLFVSSIRQPDDIKKTGWWTVFSNPSLTLENYQTVLFGSGSSGRLADYFINSLVIALPSVLIPLALGLMAAYAFCFLEWKGKDVVFLIIFGLQIVPVQMALIPLLRISVSIDLSSISPFLPIWIMHTIFAMPLAVFLLHNFMSEIPQELIEAARVDGASDVSIFLRVVLPLMLPGIASYATLQFLWVWNDLLIALTFVGGNADAAPLTVRLANLAGTNGVGWHLLTSGAFVSMIIPLAVFFLLERYIVRGTMAGSVKG